MLRRADKRLWVLSGAVFFLTLFFVFVRTHAASLYLDDSGETVTAAALLGIGHPPGYPLHTLLSHAWLVIPLGGLPPRLNLLASFCGALTATILFIWICRHRTRRQWIVAAWAATLVALGPVFWHNALGAKGSIYQLNNLMTVGLLALLTWEEELSLTRVRAFWLVLGLSLAHHYMSQLPLLPAYGLLIGTLPGTRNRWQYLKPSWLLLPGISVYVYIFLRSPFNPGLDWGAVHNFQDFWFFFFRLQYASAEGTRSFLGSVHQGSYALVQLWREGFYILLPVAVASFFLIRRRRVAQALAATWLLTLLAVSIYLNLVPERLDIMRPYLFPAYLAQAALAGMGTIAFLEQGRWQQMKFKILAPLCILLGLGALALNYSRLDLSRYFYAQDNARNLLDSLPPHAIVFAQGDAIIFPLWYEQRVLRVRPDVAVVGIAVLPMPWVRNELKRSHPDVLQPFIDHAVGAESVNWIVQAMVQFNAGRLPLYTAYNKLEGALPGWHLVSEGSVYRLVKDGDADPKDLTLIPRARLRACRIRGYTKRPLDDRTLRLIVGDFAIHHNSLGVTLEEAGQFESALDWYRHAARIHPESPEFPFNQGNVLYALKRFDDASHAFKASLAVQSDYEPALYNLGVTFYQTGNKDGAIQAFKLLLALMPDRQDIRLLLQQLGVP